MVLQEKVEDTELVKDIITVARKLELEVEEENVETARWEAPGRADNWYLQAQKLASSDNEEEQYD